MSALSETGNPIGPCDNLNMAHNTYNAAQRLGLNPYQKHNDGWGIRSGWNGGDGNSFVGIGNQWFRNSTGEHGLAIELVCAVLGKNSAQAYEWLMENGTLCQKTATLPPPAEKSWGCPPAPVRLPATPKDLAYLETTGISVKQAKKARFGFTSMNGARWLVLPSLGVSGTILGYQYRLIPSPSNSPDLPRYKGVPGYWPRESYYPGELRTMNHWIAVEGIKKAVFLSERVPALNWCSVPSCQNWGALPVWKKRNGMVVHFWPDPDVHQRMSDTSSNYAILQAENYRKKVEMTFDTLLASDQKPDECGIDTIYSIIAKCL